MVTGTALSPLRLQRRPAPLQALLDGERKGATCHPAGPGQRQQPDTPDERSHVIPGTSPLA